LNLMSEHQLQQKTAKALYATYGGCADGFIGFTHIAIGLDTPDIVVLSHECEDLHTVTIFEVKMSIKWDVLGQLYRYSLYAPTYVVIPTDQIENLKKEYTLFQALRDLGIGVATVDEGKKGLKIILRPDRSLGTTEQVLYDVIMWQVFRDLSKTPPERFSKIYNAIMEFLRGRLKFVISLNEIPILSSMDKHVIRALINALSLLKIALPLAENPYTLELLNPDIFRLSPNEFMKQLLLSRYLAKLVSLITRLVEKDSEGTFQQCYIPVTLLLLYTKGLPLRLISQTYDVLCERIREDLYECYKNVKLYLDFK